MKCCCSQGGIYRLGVTVLALLAVGGVFGKPPEKVPEPVVLLVLDPLAKELACACVKASPSGITANSPRAWRRPGRPTFCLAHHLLTFVLRSDIFRLARRSKKDNVVVSQKLRKTYENQAFSTVLQCAWRA